MKKLSALILAGGLAAGAASAQQPNTAFTRPAAPAKDALDRLNLTQAWLTHVPTDGPKDGIESVQHLGTQVIVQTRRGDIVSLDPKTGAIQNGGTWRASIGNPYHVTHEVGYNDQLILVTGATRVYGLDRATGEQVWVADLPATPSSPPVADSDGFYICLSNGRLAHYEFPVDLGQPAYVKAKGNLASPVVSRGKAPSAPPPVDNRNFGFNNSRIATGNEALYDRRTVQSSVADIGKRAAVGQIDIKNNERGQLVVAGPKLKWEYATHRRIEDRPLLSGTSVLVVSTDKYAIIVDKKTGYKGVELTANGAISAPIGRYGEIGYAADRDGTVYCYDLTTKAVLWTYSTNSTSTIRTEPRATDEDLYVNADNGGLIRLDRATGVPHWQSPDAYRYLTSNRRYVYATDKHGQLLVLDRGKGAVLARYDASGYTIAIANDWSDRIILAAQDGSVLCLYDRGQPTPLLLRANEPKVAQSIAAVKKPVEKDVKVPESREVEPKPKADVTEKAPPEPKAKTPAKPKGKG